MIIVILSVYVLQRAHIVLTITNPSESLLNELRTVECAICFVALMKYEECRKSNTTTPTNNKVTATTIASAGTAAATMVVMEDGKDNGSVSSGNGGGSLIIGDVFIKGFSDMKRQCDEKREVYEYMITQQKEKGRSKSSKGESITPQQLQEAHDEFEEEATLCAFRLKSLKQGQLRSLLTQAARHHAAQLNFFRRGLKSLEDIEPQVRMIAEQQHIDYEFSGLEDVVEGVSDDEYKEAIEGELSFDYRTNRQGPDIDSTSNSELEESDLSFVRGSTAENAEMICLEKTQGDFKVPGRDPRVSSYSAPILAEKKVKFDPAEKVRQMLASPTTKSSAYVLPTPLNIKESKGSSVPRPSASGLPHNLWHSSPLDEKKNEKDFVDGKLSEPTIPRPHTVLKESNSDTTSTQLPRPLSDGLSPPQVDIFSASDAGKKTKRLAFSGPLTNKPSSGKPVLSAISTGSTEPPPISVVLTRLPVPQPSSPKVSPSASPPLVSSPRISELHELPRPPGNPSTKQVKSSRTGHSAPLVFRNPEHPVINRLPTAVSSAASPLPTPPIIVSRSFSIPSSSQRAMALNVSKFLDNPQVSEQAAESASPLTPASQRARISDLATHSSEIQGYGLEVSKEFITMRHLSPLELAFEIPPHLTPFVLWFASASSHLPPPPGVRLPLRLCLWLALPSSSSSPSSTLPIPLLSRSALPLLSSSNVATFSSLLNQCRQRATAPAATTAVPFENQNRGELSLSFAICFKPPNSNSLLLLLFFPFFFSLQEPETSEPPSQPCHHRRPHFQPPKLPRTTVVSTICNKPEPPSPSQSFFLSVQTTASEPLTSLAPPPPNPNSAPVLTLSSTPTSCRQCHHHHQLLSRRTFRATTVANVSFVETKLKEFGQGAEEGEKKAATANGSWVFVVPLSLHHHLHFRPHHHLHHHHHHLSLPLFLSLRSHHHLHHRHNRATTIGGGGGNCREPKRARKGEKKAAAANKKGAAFVVQESELGVTIRSLDYLKNFGVDCDINLVLGCEYLVVLQRRREMTLVVLGLCKEEEKGWSSSRMELDGDGGDRESEEKGKRRRKRGYGQRS
ncbi:hypothetical protein Ahy_B06g084649 isoform B [Arachis hypogaea]|uniref:BAR domain-containing protein n=1 Tax=Arachis hypogaea TaxID=3818 RepID=A0A444YSF7_ARAHY|nr:hypothetical protein Ahy_B06g084649 isoform B [Arachis hypogaea]